MSESRPTLYRPPRERVKDLFGARVLWVQVYDRRLPITDVSMNGLAASAGREPPPITEGTEIPLRVMLGDQPVHQGLGRVARVWPTEHGWQIAFKLVDGFMDLPRLLRLHEQRGLDTALESDPIAAWEAVPRAYREAVGQAAWLVSSFRRLLDRHEARFREMGRAGRGPIDELTARAVRAIRGPWDEVRANASRAARPLMRPEAIAMRRAAKALTEAVLTPLLLDSPVIHRAYTKPLRYAGDYETLGLIYRNAAEGTSIFARVFHLLAVTEPLAEGVRTRRAWLSALIRDEAERVTRNLPTGDSYRVTNLGAGPALEVADVLGQASACWARSRWTLVDLEENALSSAYAALYPQVQILGPRAGLTCHHTSYERFLTLPMEDVNSLQHLIYAAGLFDYIPGDRAPAVVTALYDRLAPGGLLVVGNALAPNDHSWFGEFVLDWQLIFRTRRQMIQMAGGIPSDARRQVVAEPAGAYYFLTVRKPSGRS